MQLEWTKVKVKGISWPPKTDIILVSRFLPGSLIWPQILSEIGPKWIRQSLICNMCGRLFPQVANIKKYLLATLYELSWNQVFWPAFQLINIYCVMTKWPTFYKGTSSSQVCCKENESKSFGNQNPFVGWTLACPSLSQLSRLNSQETPLNLKSLDSWPTFESIESVRVSCHAR